MLLKLIVDLINLQASLCLPKSVEHFVSDLHGEYELFYHILNNCSGVIKEKVDYVFGARLTDEEKAEIIGLGIRLLSGEADF